MSFILSHLFLLTPILNFFGFGLKKSKVHNKAISPILLLTGWLLCTSIGRLAGADWLTAIVKFGGMDGTIYSAFAIIFFDIVHGVFTVIKDCLKREFLIFF